MRTGMGYCSAHFEIKSRMHSSILLNMQGKERKGGDLWENMIHVCRSICRISSTLQINLMVASFMGDR